MDDSLWWSVDELLAETGDGLPPSADDVEPPRPTDLLDYAAYFDLTLTPAEGELSVSAKAAAAAYLRKRQGAIGTESPVAAPVRVTNYSSEDYTAEQIEQMRRWWDIEPANRMAMVCATDDEAARSRELIDIAMTHLRDAAPVLHAETRIIIRDIVLTRPDGSNRINYSGASSFALWGALTINVETNREWMQFYRQIVHEAGHNLLFGIAREQPLVDDDPSDRRSSPIRADPRPMDGIFHAAFVSAREALALDALLCRHESTGCLSDDDAGVIEDLLELSVLAFWDCSETLRAEAQLTTLGVAVLSDCEAYMSANFAVEPC